MKKIALFSLLMCLGYIGIASAGEVYCGVECNAAREGRVALCPQQSNSETVDKKTKICNNGKWEGNWDVIISRCDNYKKPDGWMDFGKYQHPSNGLVEMYAFLNAPKTGVAYVVSYYVTDSQMNRISIEKNNVCYGCRQGFEWVDKKGCVATSKTQIEQGCDPNHLELCNQNSRIEQLSQPCAGKAEKDQCFALSANAELGRCRNLSATTGGAQQMTCSAVKCKPGNYLWLDKNGNSMGVCHSKSYMDSMCSNNKCGCEAGKECVPNIVDIPSYITINGYNLTAEQRKDGAYRECHCVGGNGGGNIPEDTPVVVPSPNGDCVYKFSRTIKCANGEIYSGEHTATFSREDLGTPNCPTFEERFAHDVAEAVKLADKVCLEKTGGKYKSVVYTEPVSENYALAAAKKSLEEFFDYSKSNRSGLKTADGKFNTTRLASDIAAGVVLGTVGGVVSGVVIKKKQVEKGFDALHCTVGGQKIADWGDTFEVGLQK